MRGWSLVYQVETKAKKLKNSVSGPGLWLDCGLARLRQEFVPGTEEGGGERGEAHRLEHRPRALSEQSPKAAGAIQPGL